MGTSVTNIDVAPQDGWIQVAATAAKFLRISAYPHSHPFYLYFGSSAPSLASGQGTGTLTFSGGVPTAAQHVIIGTETFTFRATAADPFDVDIVEATPGTGSVIFATGVPVADQTVTIGSEVYTFKAAAANPFEVTIGATNLLTAANLVTTITADSLLVTAVAVGGTVNLTSILLTIAGNYALSETATNVTVSGAAMTGGQNGALLTAVSMKNAINTYSTLVTATESGGVVTVLSLLAGVLGNFTFTENASNVAISGSGALTGGADFVDGLRICHDAFWSNVLTTEPCFARVVNPVPNSNNIRGALRLDVMITT